MIELTLAWGNEKVHVNPAHVEHVHQELRLPNGGNTEVMTTIVTMQSGMAFLVKGTLADVVTAIGGDRSKLTIARRFEIEPEPECVKVARQAFDKFIEALYTAQPADRGRLGDLAIERVVGVATDGYR